MRLGHGCLGLLVGNGGARRVRRLAAGTLSRLPRMRSVPVPVSEIRV